MACDIECVALTQERHFSLHTAVTALVRVALLGYFSFILIKLSSLFVCLFTMFNDTDICRFEILLGLSFHKNSLLVN